ncbi:unnamed protein product [Rhodiola kirilowii]
MRWRKPGEAMKKGVEVDDDSRMHPYCLMKCSRVGWAPNHRHPNRPWWMVTLAFHWIP